MRLRRFLCEFPPGRWYNFAARRAEMPGKRPPEEALLFAAIEDAQFLCCGSQYVNLVSNKNISVCWFLLFRACVCRP